MKHISNVINKRSWIKFRIKYVIQYINNIKYIDNITVINIYIFSNYIGYWIFEIIEYT